MSTRTFNNYSLLCEILDEHHIDHIISGGATGADSLAIRYTKVKNIEFTIFLANWDQYGKAAGPIRNKEIVKDSDAIIAFGMENLRVLFQQ